MKLAILGSSPIALEAALRFHHHGAALTWFNGPEDEPEALFHSVEFSPSNYITDLGKDYLLKAGAPQAEINNFKSWKVNYYQPLTSLLKTHQSVRPYELVSLTKRYVAPFEQIPGKSRFFDLFRIIYQVDPKEFIESQKESNPETYEKLSQEFLHSLQSSLEMYEDFDVVIDLRRETQSSSLAITGRALGEGRISKEIVHYGLDAIKYAESLKPSPAHRDLTLIGSGSLAAEVLLALRPWLQDERSNLFIVTTEAAPFESFLKEAEPATASQLHEIFKQIEDELEKEIEVFQKKIHEWRELDDFVQVKIPQPVEPIPRVNFFSGHNVTAIDQLVDRKRIFLTLEKPEFREGLKHPENNHLDLKTIGTDQVLVASPLKKRDIISTIEKEEKGHFSFRLTPPNRRQAWNEDLRKLKEIEDEIFKLFSPVHPD
jgi:hypothetical protein